MTGLAFIGGLIVGVVVGVIAVLVWGIRVAERAGESFRPDVVNRFERDMRRAERQRDAAQEADALRHVDRPLH